MKTTKWFTGSLMALSLAALLITSCKKDDTPEGLSDSMQQLSKDENDVEAAADEAMNDASAVLSSGKLKSTSAFPCNATIDSTSVVNDTITYYITYNGLSCNGKFLRTGQVQVRKHVNTHWIDPGATVKLTIINLDITRVATGRHLVLNGSKTFENVTGGYIWQVGNGISTVVHKAGGQLLATFDDGTTREWYLARQRTFTGTPGDLSLTVDGFGTSGSYTSLVVWGLNRKGEQFYSQINQPVVRREACGWDPVSGILVHQIPADSKSCTLTFGYDINNQPINPGDCPVKYRLDWQKNGNSGTVYLFL